jgi:hypothetical protein
MEQLGALSDGFNITVFPVKTASGIVHSGIMKGKLKGVTDTQTPY